MRTLLGIILGGILTVVGAYLYDSHHALEAANAPASAQRPLVNWDVSEPNAEAQHARRSECSGSPADCRHAQALSAMR